MIAISSAMGAAVFKPALAYANLRYYLFALDQSSVLLVCYGWNKVYNFTWRIYLELCVKVWNEHEENEFSSVETIYERPKQNVTYLKEWEQTERFVLINNFLFREKAHVSPSRVPRDRFFLSFFFNKKKRPIFTLNFTEHKSRNRTFIVVLHFIVRPWIARAFFIVHMMLAFCLMMAENARQKFALWKPRAFQRVCVIACVD